MLREMKLGLVAYWRWVRGGGFWRKVLGVGGPVVAVLVLVAAASGGGEESTAADVDGEPAAKATVDVAGTAAARQEATAQYIEGLAAVDVTKNLKNRKLDCSGPTSGEGYVSWFCKGEDLGGLVQYSSNVIGRSPTQIISVSTCVTNASTLSTDSVSAPLLGYVATLPYKNAKQAQSRAWLEANVAANGAEMTVGSARFVVGAATERARCLEISAAGATLP